MQLLMKRYVSIDHRPIWRQIYAGHVVSRGLHLRNGTSSSSSSSETVQPLDPFFGRERELQKLQELCSGIPTSISVILGPRNSGKTRLLHHFANHAVSPDGSSSSHHSGRCHINARVVSVSTPREMARALQEHSMPSIVQQLEVLGPFMQEGAVLASAAASFVSSMQARLKEGDGSLGSSALSAALETFLMDKAELELTEVLQAYHKVLNEYYADLSRKQQQQQEGQQPSAVRPVPSRPVLILDEANVLMQWSQDSPAQLRALLRFFIAVTKEGNSSHVLLATSDSSFHTWLTREIAPSFFQTFVVGDFQGADARAFLDLQLSRQQRGTVSDNDWGLVQQVCGGNPGALANAACAYRVQGDWLPALEHVAKDTAGTMWWGMFPPDAAGYTAKDFAAAVHLLLASPYAAVHQSDVVRALPGGLASLEAMIKADLLALRPYSDWASDVDPKAFGDGQRRTVITAASPMHYYVMKAEEQRLLAPLWDKVDDDMTGPVQDAAAAAAASGGNDTATVQAHASLPTNTQSSSSSINSDPGVASALQHVQDCITKLEADITDSLSDIRELKSTTPEGWQQEVAALRRGVEQLRDEKLQLRQMELMLLSKQLGQLDPTAPAA